MRQAEVLIAKMEQTKKLPNQLEIEQSWCEENNYRAAKKNMEEMFEEMGELSHMILATCITTGYTPASNIIGSVAARVADIPNDGHRAAILATIMRLSEKGHLDIVVGNIVFVSPSKKLPSFTGKNKFVPPLVKRPHVLTHNNMTGYHFNQTGRLVAGHAANHHDGNISLDVLNIHNRSPWKINYWVVNNFTDKRPNKVPVTQWNMYLRETSQLLKILGTRKIYFTHQVDMRGRLYCHGYHLNYQGNEYRRAMIDLGIGEYVKGEL